MRPPNKRSLRAAPSCEAFICDHCGLAVSGLAPGTEHRNHCPHCLWSMHVDIQPGDRRCGCRGPMEPLAIWVKPGGEWAIIHRCRRCAAMRANRIAGDDSELVLISLAVRPLANPPFPLDRLAKATLKEDQH